MMPLFVYDYFNIEKIQNFVLILLNSRFEAKPMVSSSLFYE